MYAGTDSENYQEPSIKLQSFLHISCGDLRKGSSESCCSAMEYPLRTDERTEEAVNLETHWGGKTYGGTRQ